MKARFGKRESHAKVAVGVAAVDVVHGKMLRCAIPRAKTVPTRKHLWRQRAHQPWSKAIRMRKHRAVKTGKGARNAAATAMVVSALHANNGLRRT